MIEKIKTITGINMKFPIIYYDYGQEERRWVNNLSAIAIAEPFSGRNYFNCFVFNEWKACSSTELWRNLIA